MLSMLFRKASKTSVYFEAVTGDLNAHTMDHNQLSVDDSHLHVAQILTVPVNHSAI